MVPLQVSHLPPGGIFYGIDTRQTPLTWTIAFCPWPFLHEIMFHWYVCSKNIDDPGIGGNINDDLEVGSKVRDDQVVGKMTS